MTVIVLKNVVAVLMTTGIVRLLCSDTDLHCILRSETQSDTRARARARGGPQGGLFLFSCNIFLLKIFRLVFIYPTLILNTKLALSPMVVIRIPLPTVHGIESEFSS